MDDVLEDRRQFGDFGWVLRRFSPPVYKWKRRTRSFEELKRDVVASVVVRNAIELVSESEGRPYGDVEKEAVEIVEEMSHTLSMRTIRFFGLLLAKTMKRLYKSINVNRDGIETIRKLVPELPILLAPTHRSYVDFMVVSYIFFHFNLPLPIIAAGQDFMSMKLMSRLMREAGAFFIRRTFGKDRLYWSVFSEYIQTQLVNGDSPFEFFIEGTRSRSGKAIYPKFGILTTCMETFFKSFVPDIVIVPISISYERTLEDSLFAHELLGVPKPRETTSGLIKALQHLGSNYGSVEVVFGKPVSVWQFFGNSVDRAVHNSRPRHLSSLCDDEQKAVASLALHIIDCHHDLHALYPFVCVSAILLTSVRFGRTEVDLRHLTEQVLWLLTVLGRLNVSVRWDGGTDPLAAVRQSCAVHDNVCTADEKTLTVLSYKFPVESNEALRLEEADVGRCSSGLLNYVVSSLHLCHYGNQLLHAFVPEALLCLVFSTCLDTKIRRDWITSEYDLLEKLLEFEFVLHRNAATKSVPEALLFLSQIGSVVAVNDEEITVNREDELFKFLCQLFEPFLMGYKILCWSLLKCAGADSSVGIAKTAQRAAARCLSAAPSSGQCRILSLDLLNNGINALHRMGALRKICREDLTGFEVVRERLLLITRRLDKYVKWLNIDATICGGSDAKL